MQCEIRGMRDVTDGASSGTDTLPRPGRVNEVCREWLVKEDGALATRLQTEEFQQHYTGNKSRNAQVREDFPRARDEQQREEEAAAAMHVMYRQMVLQQEEVDANVARQLAERLEWEESESRRAIEEEDKLIAKRLQEREKQQLQKKPAPLPDVARIHYDRDMNSVGLPSPLELTLSDQFRICALSDVAVQTNSGYTSPEDLPEVSPRSPSSVLGFDADQARLLQEQRDADLARRLQEEEGGRQQLSMLDQDRLIAIEAQDKELARLLQEKERAKARRSRERAKQKALSKRQAQGPASEDEGVAMMSPGGSVAEWAEPVVLHSTAVRPTELDLSGPRKSRQRYLDPEAIEVCHSSPEPGPSHGLPNIAMAIDPTYPRRATADTPVGSPPVAIPTQVYEEDEDDDSLVLPYMPIQGQRRIASLEKKGKRSKGKDSCKQQ